MNRIGWLGIVILLHIPITGVCYVSPWKNDVFGVGVTAPPAALLVIRSDGLRVGADPDKPISAVGKGTSINEFPSAWVDQQNTATDEADGTRTPAPETTWGVSIHDESPATYTVQLRGLEMGVATLHYYLIVNRRPSRPSSQSVDQQVLMLPGIIREFQLSSDRNTMTISGIRIVRPQDLEQSVDIACQQGFISSKGVCQSLTAKARAAGASMARGNLKAARAQIQAFQAELNAQAGQHIKEPALTILREEAEALLTPPPPMPKPKPKGTTKTKK